jgi:hypothetical protein
MRNNSTGKFVAALAALALAAPLAAVAQTTVFNDTFGTGNDTVQGTAVAPTASSTSFEYFQQGGTPATPTIAANDLHLAGRTTTSSISEVQALFTTAPVTLATVGDYIDLTIVFTDTQNIFPAGSASTLNIGLYNSGGTSPATGARLDSTGEGTGGAVGWTGYNARIGGTGSSSPIFTRAPQGPGLTNPNQSQDVLFNGASGSSTYSNPAGTNVMMGTPSSQTFAAGLTAATTYTLDYQILLSAANTLTISNAIYSGNAANPANILFSEIGTTNSVGGLVLSYDALALGWRFNSTSAANSIDISSINVSDLIQTAPEPGTLAVLGGGALVMVLIRRRRSGS